MTADLAAKAIIEQANTDPTAAASLSNDYVNALLTLAPRDQGAALKELTKTLRRNRAFPVLEAVCEATEAAGIWWGWPLNYHCQALIERGAYLTAIGLLQTTRRTAIEERDDALLADAWSLEGRAYKDLFVNGSQRRPRLPGHILERFARRSEAAYAKGFRQLEGTPNAHYPAINRMAIDRLALRKGIELETDDRLHEIAEGVIAEVDQRLANEPKDVPAWDIASAAEAAAYLERWDEVPARIEAYIEAAGDDAFAFAGTLRQFETLYGDRTRSTRIAEVLDLLKLALMKADGGSVQLTKAQTARLVTAPAVEDEASVGRVQERVATVNETLEKVWGAEGGISHRRLQDVMQRARAVARVMMQTEQSSRATIGTGFLLDGGLASDSLKGNVLFMTNAHVVSDDFAHHAPARAGEAWASFDASPELGDLPLDDLLWSSGPDEHDVSVFRIKPRRQSRRLRAVTQLMQVARGLPYLKQVRDGRKVPTTIYIIGYPMGDQLSYSMRDNELVDHENVYGVEPGPEPRRIHYLAPTQKGNSGSPVFNARTLELIGIHHAGGTLGKLNGNPGTYNVNEGLWIQPLLHAFRLAL